MQLLLLGDRGACQICAVEQCQQGRKSKWWPSCFLHHDMGFHWCPEWSFIFGKWYLVITKKVFWYFQNEFDCLKWNDSLIEIPRHSITSEQVPKLFTDCQNRHSNSGRINWIAYDLKIITLYCCCNYMYRIIIFIFLGIFSSRLWETLIISKLYHVHIDHQWHSILICEGGGGAAKRNDSKKMRHRLDRLQHHLDSRRRHSFNRHFPSSRQILTN